MARKTGVATTTSCTESPKRVFGSPRSRLPGAGFTLVEIILVVAIAAVMMGGAAVFLTGEFSIQNDFSVAREALEMAIQGARNQALQGGRDQQVLLFTNQVARTKLPAGMELNIISPAEISAGIRSWGRPPKSGYAWYFSSYGWIEPLRIRLRMEDGQWETFSFAALTGELIPESSGP